MNKKILKKIYILKYEKGLTSRQIKRRILSYYNEKISVEEIRRLLHLKKENGNHPKYTEYQKNVMMYLYKRIENIDRIISYIKKRFNITVTKIALNSMASKLKVKREKPDRTTVRFVNRKEEQDIIKMYKSGYSSGEIIKFYKFKTSKSILDILNKNNVSKRNSKTVLKNKRIYKDFDLSYINTEFKAYLIGLLITDGYIHCNKKIYQYFLQISMTDEDVIKFISENVNTNYRMLKKYKKTSIYQTKIMYRVQIHGEEYIEQIKRYGLHQNKTLTTEGVALYSTEEQYLPYIIRGMIDGDGWIRKDGKEFYICTASAKLKDWIVFSLQKLGFVNMNVMVRKDNIYNDLYYIRTARKENIKLLKQIVYDKPFGMQRKYNRVYNS